MITVKDLEVRKRSERSLMSVALGIILSFTAAIAWGTGMVIFKVGVKNIDPLTATYVKGLLAVPILIVVGLIEIFSHYLL
ncbi:MAG: EamA family transporter [Candidatus Heimdallarchaeaceae archaeon]